MEEIMEEMNESKRDQYIVRTTSLNRADFNFLKMAKDCNHVIKIKRAIGDSYFFMGQRLNIFTLTFGYTIRVTCEGEELMCVIDRGFIPKFDDTEIELTLFNSDFFKVDVKINSLQSPV